MTIRYRRVALGRVVVLYTESFLTQQLQGVTQNLVKCQKKLLDLAKSLGHWRQGKNRGKKPTVRSVRMRVNAILSAQFMKNLIQIGVKEDKTSDIPLLSVIKTDCKESSKQTIHDRYKSLAEIEWAFRTMKTSLLHLRGIFVRKANRTRAHVVIIMIAYLLAYELRRVWQDLEITIEEGIEELSCLCATEVKIGNVFIQTIPEPRPMGMLLFQRAGITLPDAIPSKNIKVHTRKKLVEERRSAYKTNS